MHLALQVDGARVGVELARAEVVVLVAPGDADDDVVAGVGRRRPDAEDLCRDDGVGLEAQLVVGDPQRSVLALDEVRTAVSLAASVRGQTSANQLQQRNHMGFQKKKKPATKC